MILLIFFVEIFWRLSHGSRFFANFKGHNLGDGIIKIWKYESFDKILFKEAVAEAAEKSNIDALRQLFSTEEIKKLFTTEQIKTLKEDYYPEGTIEESSSPTPHP